MDCVLRDYRTLGRCCLPAGSAANGGSNNMAALVAKLLAPRGKWQSAICVAGGGMDAFRLWIRRL
jgi:hypothetical protein